MKDLFLLTPPFTQLNTPYPATAYLKGFLNTKNIASYQMDLGIEVILAIFSKKGLEDTFYYARIDDKIQSVNAKRIYVLKDSYINTIDATIAFLQGNNQSLARQICSGNYLPEAARFENLQELDWTFGHMGMQDKAKHLATLYLEDLSDFIVECVDENFGFSRYAERLGRSANSFDEIYAALNEPISFIDKITLLILAERIEKQQPILVCISVPFPGNLFSAFRCAQFIKKNYPNIKIAMGGGFPNTELRSLKDVRVFEFFDFITLDDGELPIELLYLHVQQKTNEFKRTFRLENGEVVYLNNSTKADYKQTQVGTPSYQDLALDKYISVIEVANPMHSLWSDGRWNKLTMAHGCYWAKCSFCDVSLDYIKLYEPVTAKLLVDRMEQLIEETEETGFHFVDEAAPPALMKALALEILKRDLSVTWWTNIRFEKSFTKDLCYLLKASGCIAISGGLEVASDRLLKLIEKGVTVKQVAQVCNHLTESGIMVHAYLMYGYPTQSKQETIDSLEMVRQLFEYGVIQSAFWHQFALTAHSPIGLDPEKYKIEPQLAEIHFANNDVEFIDKTGVKHEKFSEGLKKSLYNFMHDIGFDLPLQEWFNFKIPETTIASDFISNCIEFQAPKKLNLNAKVVWLGALPIIESIDNSEFVNMMLYSKTESYQLNLANKKAAWMLETLKEIAINSSTTKSLAEIKNSYELEFEQFENFWYSDEMACLQENGIIVL